MSDRILCFVLALCGLFSHACEAASTLVFSTGFEQSEGYVVDLALAGQKGWVGQGTGGNIITHTLNQQVRLGYTGPTSDSETSTSLSKPFTVFNVATNTLVQFSVNAAILDSTTIGHDEFRFSAYNTNGVLLLSLVFDNSTLTVAYSSSDGIRHETGTNFVNGHFYSVVILMDFNRNRWKASLDGHDLPINAPIRTGSTPSLNLGAVRPVWFYHDPTSPGDNYMLFDDYRVTLETVVTPSVQALSAANGQFRLRIFGEDGTKYAVEGSSNLATNNWLLLGTNMPAGGSFDFTNSMNPFSRRFYRARWVP